MKKVRDCRYSKNHPITDYKRIALLIPHTDVTLETDLQRELASDNILHTERLWLDEVSIVAEEKMLKHEVPRAINYLRPTQPQAAVFGCTSASAISGLEGEKKLVQKISYELACVTISAFGAVMDCLMELHPQVAFLFTPYPDELTDRVAETITSAGIHIAVKKGMRMASDTDIARTHPRNIIQFIESNFPQNVTADCMIISCTNLRSFECAAYLQQKYQMPVITSNLAIHRCLSKVL